MNVFLSKSLKETRNFAKNFAKTLKKGQIFALIGEVGCGKTEFVRGVLEELSPQTSISSPTFSIVNTYKTANFIIYHFDFYRIKNINELFETGFDEYLSQDAIVFIEWANMYSEAIPAHCKTIKFEAIEENLRKITLI
ncbi:MAG: tRNA (adenosine(37)-N6)-threonylcarbamoyltransferase complex ATPase subunit type 1 TsaE [Chitinivibrionia bacterium]|nr:tRNA (adenosine(37)-N6)-threonylcarbamoyltransferase complex ATPase subunit type 1 TsaE [Chitinivibrionia bacterium]